MQALYPQRDRDTTSPHLPNQSITPSALTSSNPDKGLHNMFWTHTVWQSIYCRLQVSMKGIVEQCLSPLLQQQWHSNSGIPRGPQAAGWCPWPRQRRQQGLHSELNCNAEAKAGELAPVKLV